MLGEAGATEIPRPRRSRFPNDIPSQMTGTILVAVDFTAVSLKALDHALRLAKQTEASIVLLHVLDPVYTGAFVNLVTKQKVRRQTRHRALKMIRELAESRMDQGVTIKCVVRDGVPECEILRFAETEGASLIVLGRQPRNHNPQLLS